MEGGRHVFAAIEKIVYWLEKAQAVATEPQKSNIAALINYYKTGDLRSFRPL